MKKTLLILLAITSLSAFSYQEIFEKIENSDCVTSSLTAEKEGFESGTAFGTVMLYTAAEVCDEQTKQLSVSDIKLKKELILSCGEVSKCSEYGDIAGAQDTYCPNAIAACRLSISKMFYLKQNAVKQL